MAEVQYIVDEHGQRRAVIMAIEEYRRLQEELESMRETIHLLKSPKMGQRLLEARQRNHGMSLEQVREELGV